MKKNIKKEKEISGWYEHKTLTPQELITQKQEIENWYEKRHRLNYRTVPLEIPGPMLLALGKKALENKRPFADFLEGILEEYLRRQKVDWRK